MKKYLFAGLVALVVLLVLPMPVLAAPSDVVVLSGVISPYINVNVLTADYNWPNMNYTSSPFLTSATAEVATSSTNWDLTVSDEKVGANKGFMVSGSTPLLMRMYVKKPTDSTFLNTLDANFLLYHGTSAVGNIQYTADFSQPVGMADAQGTYAITITFTGTTA